MGGLSRVQPFLRNKAPNDRAWLDFTAWYIGSMTEWSRFWLRETRKNFPKGDIYLCTGGHAPPEHGADFGEQCKAAGEVGGGVRITNEGSDYRANFSLTRWVASAGRQYGAYFSFEPAGEVNTNGVTARIYNATASGARGLHYYFPNLFLSDAPRLNFVRYGAQFQQRHPITEIAVNYPETYNRLRGNDFLRYTQPLRDRFDFAFLSDGQIADGGLKQVKALVLLNGNIAEEATWKRLYAWVWDGGVLLFPDGMGRLRTVEGDMSWHDKIFTGAKDRRKGRAVSFAGQGDSSAYRDFVTQTLARAAELSPASRAMLTTDGREDNLYVTVNGPEELLWLNYAAQEIKKTEPTPVRLPPYSLVLQKIGKRP